LESGAAVTRQCERDETRPDGGVHPLRRDDPSWTGGRVAAARDAAPTKGHVGMKSLVRAAGGIVSRLNKDGRREVLIVYRDRHEDWTFPKGKRRRDEEDAACARREVEEETGLRCVLGPELPPTTYRTRSGRHKHVRYWAMRAIGGSAGPGDDVDDVRWVALRAASTLLTYARDRSLLAAFSRLTRGRAAGRQNDRSRRTRSVRDRGRPPRAA